jgi:hypothetical protein
MTNQSKIRKTNQEWKLYSSSLGFILGGGVMFYGINRINEGTDFPVFLILTGVTAEIIIGIFACISIRCPECGLSWLWHAISKKDVNQWVSWLLSFEKCPRCELNIQE